MFESLVRLTIKTPEWERSLAGTVTAGGRPRIIELRGIAMDFEASPHMLFVRNSDGESAG